jgi:Fic family protein
MLNTPQIMTTKKYCKINRCSDETARKDFNGLVDLKVISPSGQGRSVKYILVK